MITYNVDSDLYASIISAFLFLGSTYCINVFQAFVLQCYMYECFFVLLLALLFSDFEHLSFLSGLHFQKILFLKCSRSFAFKSSGFLNIRASCLAFFHFHFHFKLIRKHILCRVWYCQFWINRFCDIFYHFIKIKQENKFKKMNLQHSDFQHHNSDKLELGFDI